MTDDEDILHVDPASPLARAKLARIEAARVDALDLLYYVSEQARATVERIRQLRQGKSDAV